MPDGPPEIAVTRSFDAPRERVWSEWVTPEAFADWFGGDAEVPLETVAMDVREGGEWSLVMFPAGRDPIYWRGAFQEIVPPERLVFTITDQPDDDLFALCTVELAALGGGRTEMRFEQRGPMPPDAAEAAAKGWGSFFDKVAARLASAR